MDWISNAFHPGGRDRVQSVEDGMSSSTLQVPPPPTIGRRPTVIAFDDQLSTFRHMVGIHSTHSLSISGAVSDLTHNNLHFDGRAAPNLGIYNRVVHREQAAKRGFKFAAVLINGCLGTQIVVAASLTAMGAAGSSSVGVTAFGAINTVIAGLLTYLKGSGLPNRLKFYEFEWKKVREYIEQRERDFSRPNCTLDVFEAVRIIEHMYEEVKADVQTNTPDSYVSVSDIRHRATATNPQIPKLDALMKHAPKQVQDLELKYGHRISQFLEGLAHKEEERLKQLEKGLEDGLKSGYEGEKSRAMETVKEVERGLERSVDTQRARAVDGVRDMEGQVDNGQARLMSLGRDAEREVERQRASAARVRQKVEDEIQVHDYKG